MMQLIRERMYSHGRGKTCSLLKKPRLENFVMNCQVTFVVNRTPVESRFHSDSNFGGYGLFNLDSLVEGWSLYPVISAGQDSV